MVITLQTIKEVGWRAVVEYFKSKETNVVSLNIHCLGNTVCSLKYGK